MAHQYVGSEEPSISDQHEDYFDTKRVIVSSFNLLTVSGFVDTRWAPSPVINGVITPINGRKCMGNWRYNPTYRSYFTPVVTGFWAHLVVSLHSHVWVYDWCNYRLWKGFLLRWLS